MFWTRHIAPMVARSSTSLTAFHPASSVIFWPGPEEAPLKISTQPLTSRAVLGFPKAQCVLVVQGVILKTVWVVCCCCGSCCCGWGSMRLIFWKNMKVVNVNDNVKAATLTYTVPRSWHSPWQCIFAGGPRHGDTQVPPGAGLVVVPGPVAAARAAPAPRCAGRPAGHVVPPGAYPAPA